MAHAAYVVIDLRCPAPEQPSSEVFQDKHIYHERACACGHVRQLLPDARASLRTFALLASVIDTCRQRSISPWAFLPIAYP